MTEYKRVLIQSGERRRRTGHKINSQIECTIIRKIQTSLEMFKTFYSSSDGRMNCFYSDIGCSESKVIFKWRKTNKNNENKKKKPLQGANVRTSWISFSPSQNSHETNKRRRYSPWARKWNPPPTPSGIFVDMYHFKASPKGIEKCMFALDCLVGVAVQQHSFPQQRVTGYPHQEVSQPLLKHHYRQK